LRRTKQRILFGGGRTQQGRERLHDALVLHIIEVATSTAIADAVAISWRHGLGSSVNLIQFGSSCSDSGLLSLKVLTPATCTLVEYRQ